MIVLNGSVNFKLKLDIVFFPAITEVAIGDNSPYTEQRAPEKICSANPLTYVQAHQGRNK